MAFPERVLAFLAAIAPACLIATILIAIGKRLLPRGVRSLGLLTGPFAALGSLASLAAVPLIALAPKESEPFLSAFFGAALPEEIAKFVVLTTVVLRHYDADIRRDAILAGAWVGLGFGVFENFFYVTSSPESWQMIGLVRAAVAVPFHVALGAIMGLALQIGGLRRGWPMALAVPILLHGFYDWPLMALDWDKADINIATVLVGLGLLTTLLATGYLVAWPVAGELRDVSRDPTTYRVAPASRAFLLSVAGIAETLRVIALVVVGVAVIASFTFDPRYAALLAVAVLPLSFAELWRRTQA